MEKYKVGKISFEDEQSAESAECSEKEKCCHKHDRKKEFCFSSCENIMECDLGKVNVEKHGGKILRLSLTLEDVCPEKRAAVAVRLFELDCKDEKHARGLEIFTVENEDCERRDVKVEDIVFVLPDEVSVGEDGNRRFVAEVEANYIDVVEGSCCRKCKKPHCECEK